MQTIYCDCLRQNGGLPYFAGKVYTQKGHGFLTNAIRSVTRFVRKASKTPVSRRLGRVAKRGITDAALDYAQHGDIKRAVRRGAKRALVGMVTNQKGGRRKRKKKKRTAAAVATKRPKRRRRTTQSGGRRKKKKKMTKTRRRRQTGGSRGTIFD